MTFGECRSDIMSYTNINFDSKTFFLITGGAGFIGSNLTEAILNMGYRVRVLDNFSTGNKRNLVKFLNNPKFELIEGDIRELKTCLKACEGIDYVLHQAAWGSVPKSIIMPLIYEEINIRGTQNMMEAAKQTHVKRFIYASSSSVYGDHPLLPKVEGQEGNVLSPYALTKRTNEELGKLYYRLYGLETIGMRYFNVFGKNQNPAGDYAAVIPKFIKLLLNNKAPVINGDGNHSRDFTYVKNVIEFNLKACLAPKDALGNSFNVAFGSRVSLNELHSKISEILGRDILPIYGPERGGDIRHSNADISKARQLIGYNPEYSFEVGIEETIKWYKENL